MNLEQITRFARNRNSKGGSPVGCGKDLIDLCLSSWLTNEERQNPEFEAIKLKFSNISINVPIESNQFSLLTRINLFTFTINFSFHVPFPILFLGIFFFFHRQTFTQGTLQLLISNFSISSEEYFPGKTIFESLKTVSAYAKEKLMHCGLCLLNLNWNVLISNHFVGIHIQFIFKS